MYSVPPEAWLCKAAGFPGGKGHVGVSAGGKGGKVKGERCRDHVCTETRSNRKNKKKERNGTKLRA